MHTIRAVSGRIDGDVIIFDVNSQFAYRVVSLRQNSHWRLAVIEFDADDVARESFGSAVSLVELPALTTIA